MTAKVLTFTAEVTEFEVSLRNKGLGQFLEIGFDGTLAEGATIGVFRKFLAQDGSTIAEVPMTYSWAEQSLAVIQTEQIAGLTFEGLIATSALVFRAQGGEVLGKLILLGIA